MSASSAFVWPRVESFYRLRWRGVLLALLFLVAALSSCEGSSSPAAESSSSQADPSTCARHDRAALTALYNATGGPDWSDSSNWLSQRPVSTWFGVTTAENGCLTRLDLRDNNLSGQIPPELGTLPALLYLDLRDNNLTGQFPLEWENGSNLTNLYISGNNFSGCIPSQFARLRKGILRGLHELITDAPTASETDVGTLSINFCSADDEDSNAVRPHNDALSAPPNLAYAVEGHSITVSWDAVAGAEYYILYHDHTYDSHCELSSFGRAISCEQLAIVRGGTTYTHVDAPGSWNDYWVIACNGSGCSALDSNNTVSVPAGVIYRPGTDIPPVPANLTYAHEDSSIVVRWDPVDGADYYNLFYHEHFASSCHVQSDGSFMLCDQLAANLTGTTFSHTNAAAGNSYYWVAACNQAGCSPFEGESPARPVEEIPLTPSNLTYRLHDASTVVTWDPVEGADHYNLYHHAHASFCIALPDGTFAPCEQLAANLTATTYVHTHAAKGKSYYWVVACNRGGCSTFEEESQVEPVESGPQDNDS